MRKFVLNIFCTTGISIVILALMVILRDWYLPFHIYVLQVVVANALIHTGLWLTAKLHRDNKAIDMLMDVTITAAILITFGWAFEWFALTPIWVLLIMATAIYLAAYALDMWRVREEINEINDILEKRDNNKHPRRGSI